MILFDKIIKIRNKKYELIYDSSLIVKSLFEDVDINCLIILIINYGDIEYNLNLSKLVLDKSNIISKTVLELVNELTQEDIYTYHSEYFNQNKNVRTFMSNDLPGLVNLYPYFIKNDQICNATFFIDYPDMLITCEDYDLTNVIPIIDNKIRRCMWSDKRIAIEGQVKLIRTTSILNFISFNEASSVNIIKLDTLDLDTYTVSKNKSYILVLGGKLIIEDIFYKYIYNKLILNESELLLLFKDEYDNITDIISDNDSFLIELGAANIFIRDIDMVLYKDNINKYTFHNREIVKHHTDYICMDKITRNVFGITIADEQFQKTYGDFNKYDKHVYIHEGNDQLKLIQMLIV